MQYSSAPIDQCPADEKLYRFSFFLIHWVKPNHQLGTPLDRRMHGMMVSAGGYRRSVTAASGERNPSGSGVRTSEQFQK